jgi:hypothetical protein
MKMLKPYGDLEDAKNVLDQFAKYLRVRVRFLDLLTEGLPPDAINRGDWLTAEEADGRFQRACELEEADVEAMAEMMNDRDGLTVNARFCGLAKRWA